MFSVIIFTAVYVCAYSTIILELICDLGRSRQIICSMWRNLALRGARIRWLSWNVNSLVEVCQAAKRFWFLPAWQVRTIDFYIVRLFILLTAHREKIAELCCFNFPERLLIVNRVGRIYFYVDHCDYPLKRMFSFQTVFDWIDQTKRYAKRRYLFSLLIYEKQQIQHHSQEVWTWEADSPSKSGRLTRLPLEPKGLKKINIVRNGELSHNVLLSLTCLRAVSTWKVKITMSSLDGKQNEAGSHRVRGDIATSLSVLGIASPEITLNIKDSAGAARSHHSRNEVKCIAIGIVGA